MNPSALYRHQQRLKKQGNLPHVAREIVELARNPRTNVARLAAALERDETLVATVLKRANAASPGLSQRVKNVNFAVALLGFDLLKETVVSALLRRSVRKIVGMFHEYEAFWNHSIGCAFAARYLATKHALCDPDEAFLSGLLHDIGILALQDSDGRASAGPSISRDTGTAYTSRTQLLNDHAEIGAWMVEQWELRPTVVEAVRFHPTPWKAKLEPRLTSTVHVAEVLCQNAAIAPLQEEGGLLFDLHALRELDLTPSILSGAALDEFASELSAGASLAPTFQRIITELKDALLEGVGQLPPRQKLVLALYYYEGVTIDEIAALLEVPTDEAQQLHAQAMQHLAAHVHAALTRTEQHHDIT